MLFILLSFLSAYDFADFEEYTDTESNKAYKVTSLVLLVYPKPTLRSLPVGRFARGQVIEGENVTVAENLTWISFLDKNKTLRYVIGKDYRGHCFVDPCPEPEKPTFAWEEAEEIDAESNLQYKVTSLAMPIYAKPTLRSAKVGAFVRNQVFEGVNVTLVDNLTWVQVLVNNKTRGYVVGKDSRGQCFLNPCPKVENATLEEEESNLKYKVTSLVLNVYSKTTLRSPIVGRYVRNQVFEGVNVTLAENLTWVEVIDKNKTRGFVIGKDYRGHCFIDPCPKVEKITLEEEEEEEELFEEYAEEFSDSFYEQEPDLAYKVTTQVLNVYSKPTLRSQLVGRFRRGDLIEGDNVTVAENLTWVSYMDKNKTRRYVIGKDYRGQCFLNPCPEPKNTTLEFDWEMEPNARCGNAVSFLQKDFATSCPAIKKSGCLFLAICYMGGVCTQAEVLNFWQWAVRNGKVRSSDAYIQVGTDSLVSDCCKLYKWTRRAGSATTNSARSHWWVVSGGKVVYNSVPGHF